MRSRTCSGGRGPGGRRVPADPPAGPGPSGRAAARARAPGAPGRPGPPGGAGPGRGAAARSRAADPDSYAAAYQREMAEFLRGTELQADVPEEEDAGWGADFVYRGAPEGQLRERCYLVGAAVKGEEDPNGYDIHDSLEEMARLASAAGLEVVGDTYQKLDTPNNATFIGTGKAQEIARAVKGLDADTVIFDTELSPRQARALEKEMGGARICDRTALILDIFSQRAATKEGKLQVELAQAEYQLPRLTRMWTHLERQAGGMVKGMGEKQIEVDKRILRKNISLIKKQLEQVRKNRKNYRKRRKANGVPVIALVGYTNAGKSTLLNTLSGAGVMAEDQLFATLDPTIRRVELPGGKRVLFSDTVGFIQKLPTELVAAFRATLEEIAQASLLIHVVDVSHPMAAAQSRAVHAVLEEIDADEVPKVTVWNKMDRSGDPDGVRQMARRVANTVCLSGLTGEGADELLELIGERLSEVMEPVEAVVPYGRGELLSEVHTAGIVEVEEFREDGTYIAASVPADLAGRLGPYLLEEEEEAADEMEEEEMEEDNWAAADEMEEDDWAAAAGSYDGEWEELKAFDYEAATSSVELDG